MRVTAQSSYPLSCLGHLLSFVSPAALSPKSTAGEYLPPAAILLQLIGAEGRIKPTSAIIQRCRERRSPRISLSHVASHTLTPAARSDCVGCVLGGANRGPAVNIGRGARRAGCDIPALFVS